MTLCLTRTYLLGRIWTCPNSGELDIAKDVIPGEDTKLTIKTPGDIGSADEQLDPTKDYSEVYDQFEVEEHEEDNYEFDKIVDHFYQDGVLILKVRYQGKLEDNVMDVPFPIIKKDVPLETARYIQLYVIDKKHKGFYNKWANKIIKDHT